MMSPKSNSPWPEVFAPLAIAIAFPLPKLSHTKVKTMSHCGSSNIMLKGPSLSYSIILVLLKVNEVTVG